MRSGASGIDRAELGLARPSLGDKPFPGLPHNLGELASHAPRLTGCWVYTWLVHRRALPHEEQARGVLRSQYQSLFGDCDSEYLIGASGRVTVGDRDSPSFSRDRSGKLMAVHPSYLLGVALPCLLSFLALVFLSCLSTRINLRYLARVSVQGKHFAPGDPG